MSAWDPASEVKLRNQPPDSDVVQEDLLEKCTEYGEYKLMCAIHNIEVIVTREEFQDMKLRQETRSYLDNTTTFFRPC